MVSFKLLKICIISNYLQGTASEATLVALLSAKARAVEKFKQENKDANVSEFKAKLVAYASCQSHSSVERAGLLGDVKMRLLEPDEDLSLRGKTLAKVSVKDGSSHEMFA